MTDENFSEGDTGNNCDQTTNFSSLQFTGKTAFDKVRHELRNRAISGAIVGAFVAAAAYCTGSGNYKLAVGSVLGATFFSAVNFSARYLTRRELRKTKVYETVSFPTCNP